MTMASGPEGQHLVRLSATALRDAIASGEISAVAVTQAHLDRIAETDDELHAFLYVDAESALAQAADVDRRRAAGEALGPLAGVPVAVKDVLTQQGVPTTCGSKILQGWRPPYDSEVVRRLRDADAVLIGKTNMDEFAMGSTTQNSAYGPTANPWDLGRIPGGSGGGSAAAVAAFQVPLAIGSDTGGSIRQPAALTGTVGVKPTYGAVSRYGLVALASSLDQVGPCARTVEDAALLHSVIAGHDPRDSTSLDQPVPDVRAAAADADLRGMRIGVISELAGEGFDPGVASCFAEATQTLRNLGADVVEVSCPRIGYALGAYYLILPSEASSNLARFDGMRYGLRVSPGADSSVDEVMSATREAGFGAEVKRRIMLGTYALSTGYYDAYYGQAQKVRTLIAEDFQRAFADVDVLISPTSPEPAAELGSTAGDPLREYLMDVATIPVNLAGLPAASVPMGLVNGLPVGLQIIAPAQADDRLYRVGSAFEAALRDQRGHLIIEEAPAL